jgi:hypothetical protein
MTVFCWECGERIALNEVGEAAWTCPHCKRVLRRETVTPLTPRELAEYTAEQTRRETPGTYEPNERDLCAPGEVARLRTLRDRLRYLWAADQRWKQRARTAEQALAAERAKRCSNCARAEWQFWMTDGVTCQDHRRGDRCPQWQPCTAPDAVR